MAHFSRRDYETLARIIKRAVARMRREGGGWLDIDLINYIAKELETDNPNFHRELFLHNIFCSGHEFGTRNCRFVDNPVNTNPHTNL